MHTSIRTLIFKACFAASLTGLPSHLLAEPAPTQPAGDAARVPKTQGIHGIIVTSAPDGSLIIVDQAGSQKQILTHPTTAYLSNKEDSTRDQVVKPGMLVKVYMSADGSFAQAVSARGPAMEVAPNQLRALMQVTDDEWAVLLPRIERVRELQRVAEGKPGGGSSSTDEPSAPVVMRSLLMDFWSSEHVSREMLTDLGMLRQIRAKARTDLAAARKELQEIVTPKQEVLLVLQGILE